VLQLCPAENRGVVAGVPGEESADSLQSHADSGTTRDEIRDFSVYCEVPWINACSLHVRAVAQMFASI
jgi:hypothetical protein